MYERLKDKNNKPTLEESMSFIGAAKELFDNIDRFLVNELNAEKEIKFAAHDRCWGMDYRIKKDVISMLYFEKDAFTVVVRLDREGIESAYNDLSSYTKECIENSPFRHRGYIEYRVLNAGQLADIKTILTCRISRKHKSL